MSNSYHLKKESVEIGIAAEVGTIGIVSTIVTKRRSGGSFEEIARSTNADGNIPPTKLGISIDLIGCTIITDLAVLLDGVPQNQLDQAFANIFFRITLIGGLDGAQIFDVRPTEKKQFTEKRLIVASIPIKLITQPV